MRLFFGMVVEIALLPGGIVMYDLKHWEGSSLQEHLSNYETATSKGYAVLTFTQYGHAAAPLYAAVMIKRAKNPVQRAFWALSQREFQGIVDAQAKEGWSPVLIGAHGPANGALFAGVFEKRTPVGVTALGLIMSTTTGDWSHDDSGEECGCADGDDNASAVASCMHRQLWGGR